MSSNPIMPKTFAAYIHPLKAGKNYTEGSDGKAGLSADEAKIVKTDIAISKVLTPEQKKEATAIVDQARQMTVAALKNDGKVDNKEKQAMLDLAKHTLPAQGCALTSLDLGLLHETGKTQQYKSELFCMAAGTSYAPVSKGVEGGPKDSLGKALKPHTIENVLENIKKGKNGPENYVAVAMDATLFQNESSPFKYGDVFRIPELEAIYKSSPLYFAVVDTGGAFGGTSGTKIDICSNSSYNSRVNQSLSLHKVLDSHGKQVNATHCK